MIKGIDVSHYQGNVDYNKVKSDGVKFVFIKATQNANVVDSMFKTNATNALKAGFEVGVGAYHFANFTSKSDALAEAKFFVETVKPFKFTLPLVLDLESNPNKLSFNDLGDCADTFINYVEKAVNCEVMLYTGDSFSSTFRLPKRKLWIAKYSDTQPSSNWSIWQNSEKGKVDGIAGNVDLNQMKDGVFVKKVAPKPIVKQAVKPKVVAKPVAKNPIPNKIKDSTYTVKSGDILSSISIRAKVPMDKLIKLNNIKDKDLIKVGQVLKLK